LLLELINETLNQNKPKQTSTGLIKPLSSISKIFEDNKIEESKNGK